MKKRFSIPSIMLLLVFLTVSVSVFVAQTNTRPKATSTGDIKVRYRTTMGGMGGGQPNESVTMIKGPRERSETSYGPGFNSINITQCDLKRTIQVSDSARKYV